MLTAVDDKPVTGMSQTDWRCWCAALRNTGQSDDAAVKKLIDFTVTRAHITVPNTETQVVDDIGYIRLNQFTANAAPT